MTVSSQDYISSEIGTIQIAPSVFESIATSATLEVPGIAQMSTSFVQDFFGKKGIKVEIGEDYVEIHVSVIIEYGRPIQPIVRQVQANVHEQITAMTGFQVKACHVNVQGVQLIDSQQKEKQQK